MVVDLIRNSVACNRNVAANFKKLIEAIFPDVLKAFPCIYATLPVHATFLFLSAIDQNTDRSVLGLRYTFIIWNDCYHLPVRHRS